MGVIGDLLPIKIKGVSDMVYGKLLIGRVEECKEIPKPEVILEEMKRIAEKHGMTVMEGYIVRYKNGGVNVYLAVGESHMHVSTFPESKMVYVEVFASKKTDVHGSFEELCKLFNGNLTYSVTIPL